MSHIIESNISAFIKHQFPSFYQEEGQNFITFVEAYYEWMEDNGLITKSRNILDYRDIDRTLDEFIIYFKNKFIKNLPESIRADKKLLIKNIQDIYRSKGTEASYKFLFRVLYNEDVDVYLPSIDLFRPSDSKWILPEYIEVTDNQYLAQLVGKKIVGTKNGTEAVVENYSKKYIKRRLVSILELSNIRGSFSYKEKILCPEISNLTINNAPTIIGSLSNIVITSGGSNFSVGDQLDVSTLTGEQGKAKVATVKNLNGVVEFTLVDGGSGFSLNPTITVTGGAGTGATFKVGSLKNTEIITLVEDVINDYYSQALEETTNGYTIEVSSVTGTYSNGEYLYSSTIVTPLDVYNDYLEVLPLETVTNTSLGISATVSFSNESYLELIDVTGSANVASGVQLVGGTSGAILTIQTVFENETYEANGVITNIDGANLTVTTVGNGYFSVGGIANGDSSSATGTIDAVTRITDWGFPTYKSVIQNLDTIISDAFTYNDLTVGTIRTLTSFNGGNNYLSSPTVTIVQQNVLDLELSDGRGGFKGNNASVTAEATYASGIINTVEVIDSGFAYENLQPVTLTHATNESAITGTGYTTRQGKSVGYWQDHSSFSSDHTKLQDSYYYQKYSYDIISSKLLSSYESIVKELIHPTGIALFGSIRIKDAQVSDSSIMSEEKLYSSYSNTNPLYSSSS